MFFLKLCFVIFTLKFLIIHENAINFFFENKAFTLPSLFSPKIYKFAIDINTSTTMNYQIESVNSLKFRFFLILSHFLFTQTTYLTLSLKIHQKNLKILITNYVRFISSRFLVINEQVAVVVKFWVIGETTQVISRVQGMKSRTTFYFSDLFDEEDFFRSLLVNTQVSFAIDLLCVFNRRLPQKSSNFPL